MVEIVQKRMTAIGCVSVIAVAYVLSVCKIFVLAKLDSAVTTAGISADINETF